MDAEIPRTFDIDKKKQKISYYQWVPLMLMFQAMMSFLPALLWRFLNRRSGINLTTVMDAAHVCSQVSTAAHLLAGETSVLALDFY